MNQIEAGRGSTRDNYDAESWEQTLPVSSVLKPPHQRFLGVTPGVTPAKTHERGMPRGSEKGGCVNRVKNNAI